MTTSDPAPRQLTLRVTGMACRHCVREVTAWMRDVPGVRTVAADAGTCLLVLNGSMRLADVLAPFAGSGYTPQVVADEQSARTTRARRRP